MGIYLFQYLLALTIFLFLRVLNLISGFASDFLNTMAAAQQTVGGSSDVQVQSSFPLPPKMFISKYTDEAVQRDIAPKPPALPDGSYMMFGQQCHQDDLIIRPLEMQGLQRLHPPVYDRRKELKKLTVSILCNFLDLLDVLVSATESEARDKKIEDLNMLFIHIHHLINEFRPHQARETLKVMMEMQQAQMLDVGERLWKHIEKAGDILSESSSQLATMQAENQSAVEAIELMRNQEPMNVDSMLTDLSSTDLSTSISQNAQGKNSMDTETSDIVKDIFKKDKILSGFINDMND
uniref:mediator of RNA polymerase II transcription subunit 7-like isoform X1 n=2 Tax=Styela clava TaxID=7725 RepID=UPI001939AC9F|nr:mediator of RNA polymerase II transcription subunit 7-like isoform X1 [Styela clava]